MRKAILMLACACAFAKYTELHMHLGGSFPRAFIERLATEEQKLRLDEDLSRLAKKMDYHDAFDVFAIVRDVVNTEERLREGTGALCEWLDQCEVDYAEIRTGLKDLGGGYEGYLRAVIEGLQGRHALVLSLKRADTVEKAKATVDLAIKYRNAVVGIDISDDSTKGSIMAIMPELLRAKAEGFPILIHMGESPLERDQREVLEVLQPSRIGHGVHLDKEAEEWMLEKRVPLELCMTSAYLVQMVESGEEHPGFRYLRMGHPVVIGTDDPLLFSTTMEKEFKRIKKRAGITDTEEKILMTNAQEAICKPKYLYKIVTKEMWEKSQNRKTLLLTTMDNDFIHFSKEDQVKGTIQKFFSDKNYVVVEVETEKLVGRLQYESNPGRETRYYHLYDGEIPMSACRKKP